MKYEILTKSESGDWENDFMGDHIEFDTELEAQEFMLHMAASESKLWGDCTWKVAEVDGSDSFGDTWTGPFKNFPASDLSEEQRQEFLRQWEDSYYFMDDTECSDPWCCPWYYGGDIRGNTIWQMVENHWKDNEQEIESLIAEDEAEAAEEAEEAEAAEAAAEAAEEAEEAEEEE